MKAIFSCIFLKNQFLLHGFYYWGQKHGETGPLVTRVLSRGKQPKATKSDFRVFAYINSFQVFLYNGRIRTNSH